MRRKSSISLGIFTILLVGGVAIASDGMSTASAEDSIAFASQRTTLKQHRESSVPVTLVQRRVRVYGPAIGPPIPPGPIPPFAPVVPLGPTVAPGPTHVRVRVPFFSGDFYIDGAPPAVVVEDPTVGEPADPSAGRGPVDPQARTVAYSSNAQYRELVTAYRELQDQLSTLTTGEKWKTFLQLPLEPVPTQEVLDYLSIEEGQQRLATSLGRYDRIERDPAFDVVTALPAFSRTHEALRALTDWVSSRPILSAPPRPLPPPEEIPVP